MARKLFTCSEIVCEMIYKNENTSVIPEKGKWHLGTCCSNSRKMIFCSKIMTMDTEETQFWLPAISQFQFVRTVCPLSLDIVRRLKHHDFSQSWFQLAYSRLYDYNIAEVHKPIVVVAGLQASACYYSHTCPARAALPG